MKERDQARLSDSLYHLLTLGRVIVEMNANSASALSLDFGRIILSNPTIFNSLQLLTHEKTSNSVQLRVVKSNPIELAHTTPERFCRHFSRNHSAAERRIREFMGSIIEWTELNRVRHNEYDKNVFRVGL